MFKIKKNGILIDIVDKLVFVKKNESGIVSITHDKNEAWGIVIDTVPYNVVGGPNRFPNEEAETVSVKEFGFDSTLAKLNSAAMIAENQIGVLNNSIEEAKQVMNELESAIVDLDPEGAE